MKTKLNTAQRKALQMLVEAQADTSLQEETSMLLKSLSIQKRLELRPIVELMQLERLPRNLFFDYASQTWIEDTK